VEWLGISLHHACAVCCRFREQSLRFGTQIFTETVNKADLSRRPFKLYTDEKEVTAQTVIIATGAVAKRLPFKGSDEDTGFWNKGISACAVCDGAAPIFRNKPIAVIGGGDSAMEEAMFLTKYGSEVRAARLQQEGWQGCGMVPACNCKGMATQLQQL
jgi:thioredoxin reductase (NADPH)